MLDFEGTETRGTVLWYKFPTLLFIRFLLCMFFHKKISALNCAAYSRAKHIYITLCLPRLLRNTMKSTVLLKSQMIQCKRTRYDTIYYWCVRLKLALPLGSASN